MGGAPYAPSQGSYLQHARAYATNEIIASAIDLLATSAAEPHIIGRRLRREKRGSENCPLDGMNLLEAQDETRRTSAALRSKGLTRAELRQWMIRNQYYEELPRHRCVQLLNKPNPFMSRGQFTATLVMDRLIAGNSYVLKARFDGSGPFEGAIAELWRLRPDRVKIIPDGKGGIKEYEYNYGTGREHYDPQDIVHFKTLNPLNELYGMPPLLQLMPRVQIDEYMRRFLTTFFESGGSSGPGSVLTSKSRLPQETKDDIRTRFKKQFGGPSGMHELLVLDNTESSYQNMGLNRGLRDALPKEIDGMSEARIAMRFGIPGSILGLLLAYASGNSYANKRQDWQVLWDITVTPMLSDMDDTWNLHLVEQDFSGIDDVAYDLSQIKALQEDVDAVQERHRKNWLAGIGFWEETRDSMAFDPDGEGTILIPSNMIPVRVSRGVIEMPEPPAPEPKQLPEPKAVLEGEISCTTCGSRLPVSRVEGSATVYCRHCKNEVTLNADTLIEVRATVKEIEYDARGRMVRVKESAA